MSGSLPPEGDVLLVAGEVSGDLHGGTLARALRARAPGLALHGMGGSRMARAGVRLLFGIERGSVVGATEVVGRLPALVRTLLALRRWIRTTRPRAVVLIDFPDFNLRLARMARRLGIPVAYFMAPQVWAWRRGRLKAMARDVSRVLAVFPFEMAVYQEAGVPVEFVGHPILDVLPVLDRETARSGLVEGEGPLVGLLPGSRREEVARLLPVLLSAAREIAGRLPGARFAIPVAPTIPGGPIRAAATRTGLRVQVLHGEAHRVMAGADLLVLASGTATLEAACYGAPMVVLYRLSPGSYAVARALVRGVSHIALPNIVAGREVVPELIQGRATGPAVARLALRLLTDAAARASQKASLGEVRARLGERGAGDRAARAILDLLRMEAAP